MTKYNKILITGSTGFLGTHVTRAFEALGTSDIVALGKSDYDLLQPGAARQMLEDHQPDAVLHLAAKVGGIIANRDYPADFYYENITINTQTFHAAYEFGVKKFLTFMGGCSYPGTAPSPIPESEMWNGRPQGESAPYSIAKKMMIIQSESYRKTAWL